MDGIVSFDCALVTICRKRLYLVLQEAIANGNPSLVKLIMKYRNYQRNMQRIRGIPDLLRKLKEVKSINALINKIFICVYIFSFSRQVCDVMTSVFIVINQKYPYLF